MMNRIDGTLGVARAFGDFLYKVIHFHFIIINNINKPKSMSICENKTSVKGDLVSNLCEVKLKQIY